MNLPFYEEAKELGYDHNSHSGDRTQAHFTKEVPYGFIHLTTNSDGTASLTAFYRAVILQIGPFSFPNKNFNSFENQITHCVVAINQTE